MPPLETQEAGRHSSTAVTARSRRVASTDPRMLLGRRFPVAAIRGSHHRTLRRPARSGRRRVVRARLLGRGVRRAAGHAPQHVVGAQAAGAMEQTGTRSLPVTHPPGPVLRRQPALLVHALCRLRIKAGVLEWNPRLDMLRVGDVQWRPVLGGGVPFRSWRAAYDGSLQITWLDARPRAAEIDVWWRRRRWTCSSRCFTDATTVSPAPTSTGRWAMPAVWSASRRGPSGIPPWRGSSHRPDGHRIRVRGPVAPALTARPPRSC